MVSPQALCALRDSAMNPDREKSAETREHAGHVKRTVKTPNVLFRPAPISGLVQKSAKGDLQLLSNKPDRIF